MARTVKHLSLHRIAGIELRVVADVEEGVIPIVEIEEAVIRQYVQWVQPPWPHRSVNLFVLEDLQPLVHQLQQPPATGAFQPTETGDETIPALWWDVPVVNVYDLADLTTCNVFVNRQVMVREGYWDDALAIQGLLAHEHEWELGQPRWWTRVVSPVIEAGGNGTVLFQLRCSSPRFQRFTRL